MNGLENMIIQSVSGALQEASLVTIFMVFLGGVITSLSPCILAMVPLMVGYMGGYSHGSKMKGFLMSTVFVLGLAVTFAVLGLTAASFGKIFGQIGNWWYYIIAFVSIIMGLQLLEVIQLRFPGVTHLPIRPSGWTGAFLAGLFFGLVASPCATPVLALLITYVASKGTIVYGGLLLFVYGLGHGLPLVVAGTFTALIKTISSLQRWTKYLTYLSGVLMILVGLYFLMQVSGIV